MRELFLVSAVVFLFSLNFSLLVTPLLRKLAVLLKQTDRKDRRTVHKKVVTRLGGASIFVGLFFSLLLLFFLGYFRQAALPLLAGVSIIFIVGITDDLKDLSARVKMLGQMAAASVVVFSGYTVSHLNLPFFEAGINLPPVFGILFSIFWILLFTNAVNFIDGLDGLAAGIITIAALFLSAIAFMGERYDAGIMFLAVGGSCLGFLRYNFHPAKVFMGDGGSTVLGFMMGSLTLIGSMKSPAVFPLVIPLVALGIPAADVLLAVLRRLKNRESPFLPDKEHMHHKLLKLGLKHRDSVIVLYGMTFVCGAVALNLGPGFSYAAGGFALASTGMGVVLARRVLVRTPGARKKLFFRDEA